MPDAARYTYRVEWSADDFQHAATVAEFPALRELAPTPAGALTAAVDAVQNMLAVLGAHGKPAPEPVSDRRYTGKILIRISPVLHRDLAREAGERYMSLNRLIVERLTCPEL